jgi:hypothetical protein
LKRWTTGYHFGEAIDSMTTTPPHTLAATSSMLPMCFAMTSPATMTIFPASDGLMAQLFSDYQHCMYIYTHWTTNCIRCRRDPIPHTFRQWEGFLDSVSGGGNVSSPTWWMRRSMSVNSPVSLLTPCPRLHTPGMQRVPAQLPPVQVVASSVSSSFPKPRVLCCFDSD